MSIIRSIVLVLIASVLPCAGATASFINRDTTTNGNWVGSYGTDGWYLVGDSPQSSYPTYATSASLSGWSGPFDAGANTDTRALQKASSHSSRSDSTWYTNGTATYDVTISGTHFITFYVWAGDASHGQSVSVLDEDNAGATLNTQSITDNYTTGTYLTWQVTGHIRLSITNTNGSNGGRFSGLFFDTNGFLFPSGVSNNLIFPGTSSSITLTGAGTSWSNSSTVSFSGSGISVGSVTFVSSTSLVVSLSASSGASLSAQTLTVTTGTSTNSVPFYLGAFYWRAAFTQADTSAVSIAEWKFFDSTSTPISTSGVTATASSSAAGSPANAFDGSTSTFWASNSCGAGACGEWLQAYFSGGANPASFSLTTRNDLGYQVPTNVLIEASGDGVTFTAVFFYYGLNWSGSSGASVTLLNAAPTTVSTSWRLLITADVSQSTSITGLVFKSGGSTISTPAYAAITSSSLATNGGYFAFDGNNDGYWASVNTPSSGSPEWIGYRFPSGTPTPTSFIITPRGSSLNQGPTSFSIQKSTDEATWTTVQTYSATWPTASAQTFTIPASGTLGGMILQ